MLAYWLDRVWRCKAENNGRRCERRRRHEGSHEIWLGFATLAWFD